jgi:periplasmic protein TonB
MSIRAAGKLGSNLAAKGWATSLAVHTAVLAALVGLHGAPVDPPSLHSHFGQTALLLSTADPDPGSPDANDMLADPSIVRVEPADISQPVLAETPMPQVDVTADAPVVLLPHISPDKALSLLPPQAALEPIAEPRPTDPAPSPPGDDTPTSSLPSPGRVGNDRPADVAFDDNPPILYPPAAVRASVEGTVILRIRIGVDGGVVGVELVESSGSAILDRAAVGGVRSWRGRPAQIAGRAIEAAALLPVVFRLH